MFFAVPNLRSSSVFELEKPWEFETKSPPPYEEGKTAVSEWSNDFATDHAFVSLYEGLSPAVRVTARENTPFRMHGILADYDGKMPDDVVAFVQNKPAGEYKPSWLVHTASGHYRLIWMFERPLVLSNMQETKEFLRVVSKQLRLDKWLIHLDTAAFGDPCHYYELGKEWIKLDKGTTIPASMLEVWLLKIASLIQYDEKREIKYTIPMEDLALEVEARFPGRWAGNFALGLRGVRFWDASADNPTSAIVMPDGMRCFTGNQGFVSWRQIFGQAFVEKYEAKYIAGVVEESAYDGREFWVHRGDGRWSCVSKPDFTQELRDRGYSGKVKGTASEIDRIEVTVKTKRRVERALPFLYYPTGIISYRGERYLNISTVKCLEPAVPVGPGKMSWDMGPKYFPTLHEFFEKFFVEKPLEPGVIAPVGADEALDRQQLTAFMAWLHRFYVPAYQQTPVRGHAIVIAGAAGTGKSFLVKEILSGLMGREEDAATHLIDDKQWTGRLLNSPIMRIDDSVIVSDPRALLRFSSRIKKYTANSEMVYDEKFKQSAAVPWLGRIVILCNTDSISLRILPDMDISTRDKISMFRCCEHNFNFPDSYSLGKLVHAELPYFARFLLDWDIPEECLGDTTRFGVKPFHHPALFDESRQHGVGAVLEYLTGFLGVYKTQKPDLGYWEGTATQLHMDLCATHPAAAREVTSRWLTTMLGIMEKNGYKLERRKDPTTGLYIWRIGFNLGLGR